MYPFIDKPEPAPVNLIALGQLMASMAIPVEKERQDIERHVARERENARIGAEYDRLAEQAFNLLHEKRVEVAHSIERLEILRQFERVLAHPTILGPDLETVLSKRPKSRASTEAQYARELRRFEEFSGGWPTPYPDALIARYLIELCRRENASLSSIHKAWAAIKPRADDHGGPYTQAALLLAGREARRSGRAKKPKQNGAAA
jgi:hypothetical protein